MPGAISLSDLLVKKEIDPGAVLVLRHSPTEPSLWKVLPWLAAEKPDVYNGYQQAQWPKVEKAMTKSKYIVSLIGHKPRQALFVGLYKVAGWKSVSYDQYWKIPANVELKSLGMTGLSQSRSSTLWFDLVIDEFLSEWKGKLILRWPGLERAWWRWADRNQFDLVAISEESLLNEAMPSWEKLVLTWEQLKVLPSSWQLRLREWRGIYLIFDRVSGKNYVGSAYGADNILGRWKNYSLTGHGGNKHLRQCAPADLTFCILEIDSHDRNSDDIREKEKSWKSRLHTYWPAGLNGN